MELLVLVAIIALLMLTGATVHVLRAMVASMNERPKTPVEPLRPDRLLEEVAELTTRLDKLTFAVSDGIERVARAENRIAKTVTSARRLVREAGLEHAGIEAEHDQLQPRDADPVQPLPAMPEEVAATRTIRIPGGSLMIGVPNERA